MSTRPRGRPKGSGARAAILSATDIASIVKTARKVGGFGSRAEVAALLSIEFGLTAGDLCTITTRDLFEPSGELAAEPRNGLAKSSNASRVLRGALLDYWGRHLVGSHLDGPLFQSQRGIGLTRASLARILTALYRAAGVATASSRSGRRTANWHIMAIGLIAHLRRIGLSVAAHCAASR